MTAHVLQIIAETLGELPEKILPGARLTEDLGCDSLDILEVVITLEAELEIEIEDATLDTFVTVQDVLTAVEAAQ